MIREIVDDALGRWRGDSDPQCFVCQLPLAQEDAIEFRGEPLHRDCARNVQAVTRRAARARRRGGR